MPALRLVFAASALIVVPVTAGIVPVALAPGARASDVTASQDTLRTGWDASEPGLTPAAVASPGFGQLFSAPVDGQVYAQPIVAGRTVIVATENNVVYGLDNATGAVRWSRSLGTPWPASAEGCPDLAPNVGVTGTPVYDPRTKTVYLVAKVNDGPTAGQPHFYMVAIAAQTGAVRWKVTIQGAPPGDPSAPFTPFTAHQRAGLLLSGGRVYAAFAALCDITPYDGYVAGVDTSTRALSLWSDEAGGNDQAGGIWQAGGGLMSDGPGRIFLASGNGISPVTGPGTPPAAHLGGSVVRLGVQPGGSIAAQDFFSPANAPVINSYDLDLGSGGPVGLPFGTSRYPHLLVEAGKDGRLFLLDRDSLGGRGQGPGGTDGYVSMAGPFNGLFGHPAAFGGSGGADYVYYVGVGDYLRALKFDASRPAHPVLTDVANSTGTFGYTSGSPVVTSDGTDPRSAVVWEVYASAESGAGGTLEAFDAIPRRVGGTPRMKLIWSAPIGLAAKFSIPATDHGRVYVGTRDGHVLAFGRPASAPLAGRPADLGAVAVGSASTAVVTVKATARVTVSGISASAAATTNPFKPGIPNESGVTVTLPVTLSRGDSLSVPVTLSPTDPGGVTGALNFATDSVGSPVVSVSLTGDGTRPGLYASPAALQFPALPRGISLTYPAVVEVTNGGTASETLSSVTPPAAPFTASGLPAPGTVVPPGGSVLVSVTYTPAATGNDTSSFTVAAADGSAVTVGLSGSAVAGQGTLAVSATTLDFGPVPVGTSVTQTVYLSDAGPYFSDLPLTITGTTATALPFGIKEPIAAGQPLSHGYLLPVPVTFAPAGAGPASATYQVTATDGQHPPQTVTVTLTGTGTAS